MYRNYQLINCVLKYEVKTVFHQSQSIKLYCLHVSLGRDWSTLGGHDTSPMYCHESKTVSIMKSRLLQIYQVFMIILTGPWQSKNDEGDS